MEDLSALRERLTAFLRSIDGVGADAEVTDLVQLTGGYSLLMYRFDVATAAGTSRYVLRVNPPAGEAMTHTDRSLEWALLDALTLTGSVPMPAARWADPEGTALGSPAIILDFVDGPGLLGHLNAVDDERRRVLALDVATAIGTVHAAGSECVPSGFSRPESWDDYVDGFIAEWRAVEASMAERNPFIRWVAQWLETHKPPPADLTLVHGEFQTGNVMVDSDGALQIIDWEFAHVGDPRIDLGWMQIVGAFTPPDPIGLDPMAFCERYCEVSGLTADVVNPLTIGYFAILGGAKPLGAAVQGIGDLARGESRAIASAYLVSSLPFSHRLWREGAAGLESAMAQVEALMAGAAQ